MNNIKHSLLILLMAAAILTPAYSEEIKKQGTLKRFYGLDFSYGLNNGSYTYSSSGGDVSGNFCASQPNLGIGASVNLPIPGMPENYYYDIGYHYNFISDGLATSYVHFDAIGIRDNIYGGLGINYSFWNQDITGGLGLQASTGFSLSDRLLLGIKYIAETGSKTTSEYDNKYLLSQLLLDCKIYFR